MNEIKNDIVKIVNPVQAGCYVKSGLEPIRIYFDRRWVWEFDKEKSNPLYTKWLNHEFK